MKKLLLFLVLSVLANSAWADFLVVQRQSLIKRTAASQGELIERVNEGDTLVLLDDGVKTNGYYHVVGPTTGVPGYVYQNRVRRFQGEVSPTQVSETLEWPGVIPEGYYDGTEGLTGEVLKGRLNDII